MVEYINKNDKNTSGKKRPVEEASSPSKKKSMEDGARQVRFSSEPVRMRSHSFDDSELIDPDDLSLTFDEDVFDNDMNVDGSNIKKGGKKKTQRKRKHSKKHKKSEKKTRRSR